MAVTKAAIIAGLAGAFALLMWAAGGAGESPLGVRWLMSLGLAAGQAILTVGLGLLALRALRWRPGCRVAEMGIALFLGAGIVSTLILLVGLAGGLSVRSLQIASIAALVLTAPLFPRLRPRQTTRRLQPVEVGAILMLALLAVPLALRAAFPPLAYDGLEYHLAVPRIWLREGTVFPVPGNFFSHQPFLGEMNFLLSIALGGGALLSLPLAFNPAPWLAVALMTHALARGMGAGRMLSLVIGVGTVGLPLIEKIAGDAVVDLWAVLGVQVVVYTWQRWLRNREIGAVRTAGLALGFLVTVKHPAAAFWAAPLIASMGLTMVLAKPNPHDWRRALVWGTPLALAAAMPWWLKEWAWTGNPIFPLGYGVLGGEGWSEAQAHLLVAGHGLRSPLAGAYWGDLLARQGDVDGLLWLMLLIAVGFVWQRRFRPAVLMPLVAAIFGLLAWNLLRGSADRFAAPALGLLMPMVGGACWRASALLRRGRKGSRPRALRWVGATVLAALMLPTIVPKALRWEHSLERSALQSLGRTSPSPVFFRSFPHLQAHRWLNEIERPEGRVLLIGEARTYHLDAPAVMGTVFDGQPLRRIAQSTDSLDALFANLRAQGITHAMLNLHELNRLMNLYFGGAPANPLDFGGHRPLWDFPSAISDESFAVVVEMARWVIENAAFADGTGVFVARVPEASVRRGTHSP